MLFRAWKDWSPLYPSVKAANWKKRKKKPLYICILSWGLLAAAMSPDLLAFSEGSSGTCSTAPQRRGSSTTAPQAQQFWHQALGVCMPVPREEGAEPPRAEQGSPQQGLGSPQPAPCPGLAPCPATSRGLPARSELPAAARAVLPRSAPSLLLQVPHLTPHQVFNCLFTPLLVRCNIGLIREQKVARSSLGEQSSGEDLRLPCSAVPPPRSPLLGPRARDPAGPSAGAGLV